MSFETDIFISYAHIDNQTPIEGEEGWVSNLHRALEVRVAQLRGEATDVWRDPKLHGNDRFADTLVGTLDRAALLVSVLSPRYVKSEWCLRELEEFVHASDNDGQRIGDKARIFKVLKTPVPAERLPAAVQPLLGYEFFAVDPESGRVRELDRVFGAEAQQEFWTRLEDLAQDIAALLDSLDALRGGASGSVGGSVAQAGAPAVYLADCTLDLRDQRDALRRFLRREGCEVYPKRSLPLEAHELKRAVREDLAACRISIHPVGRSYGVVPEGATESIVVLQSRIALEHSLSSRLTRFLWVPGGAGLEEERQQEFIDYLRSDAEVLRGADLLERPLEDLKGSVRTLLGKLTASPEEVRAKASDVQKPAVVYLICDQQDLEEATRVRDLIFDRGHEVILPVFEGDESEMREEHEDSLRCCDGVLVWYGEASEIWQRRKLREIQKIAGYGRERPLSAKAIAIAPPDSLQKTQLRSHEARILDLREGASGQALEPFLDDLKAATRGGNG